MVYVSFLVFIIFLKIQQFSIFFCYFDLMHHLNFHSYCLFLFLLLINYFNLFKKGLHVCLVSCSMIQLQNDININLSKDHFNTTLLILGYSLTLNDKGPNVN